MVFWGTHAQRGVTVLWALPFRSRVVLVITATQLRILGSRTVSYVMQGISVMGLDLFLQLDYVRLGSTAVEEPFPLSLPGQQ